jgi:hypothetical protein
MKRIRRLYAWLTKRETDPEAAAEAARIKAERETQKLGALDAPSGARGLKLPGD